MKKVQPENQPPIEILEGSSGNVLLKGLKELKITTSKDLAQIYEAAVITKRKIYRSMMKRHNLAQKKN